MELHHISQMARGLTINRITAGRGSHPALKGIFIFHLLLYAIRKKNQQEIAKFLTNFYQPRSKTLF
jgi:hypothetical protein